VVFRRRSSVKCEPNTNGKQTVEDLVIEAIGKTVSVTYQPRKDKTGIKKIVLADYVPPPTTTSRPTTASGVGSPGSTLDCTCRPNMTGMSEALPNFDQMPSGRAIRYVKREEAGRLLVRPVPLARHGGGGGYYGGGGSYGGYHGGHQTGVSSGGSNILSTILVGLLGAFLGALIPSLIPIVIGRSLPVEEEMERKEELVRILTKIQNTLNDGAFVQGLQRSLDQVGSGDLARGGGGGYHGHYHGGYSGVSSGGNNLISTILVGLLGAFLGATISGLLGRSLPVEEMVEREREEELVRILTRIQNTLHDRAFVEGLQRSLDRHGSGGLFSGLRDAIFQAVINALVGQFLAGLGRSAHSPKSRQLLTDLLNGQASSGASDMVNQMAMDMAQQQFEQMLASGELQEQVQTMAMEMLESGLEQMALDLLQSPEAEQMADELMAEVMRPPTEEEQALMQAMVEEVMRPPTEEEMAEMQQVWTEMMSSVMSEEDLAQMQQSWEDWEANGGMMGAMMGMNGGGMVELIGSMEMKMHCQCSAMPVESLTNPSERGLEHGGD